MRLRFPTIGAKGAKWEVSKTMEIRSQDGLSRWIKRRKKVVQVMWRGLSDYSNDGNRCACHFGWKQCNPLVSKRWVRKIFSSKPSECRLIIVDVCMWVNRAEDSSAAKKRPRGGWWVGSVGWRVRKMKLFSDRRQISWSSDNSFSLLLFYSISSRGKQWDQWENEVEIVW